MHKLVYVSVTERNFCEDELRRILAVARDNNKRLGVTGLLLYIDGGFLQVLEGDQNVVHALYDQISQDYRHWGQRVLYDQGGPRDFSDWSMGFKYLDEADNELSSVIGVTRAAVDGVLDGRAGGGIVSVLVRTFCVVQGAHQFEFSRCGCTGAGNRVENSSATKRVARVAPPEIGN